MPVVSDSLLVPWDEALLEYDLGPTHPLHPVRVELTVALAHEMGVLARPHVEVVAPTPVAEDVLDLVHDRAYVRAVKRAPDDVMGRLALRHGLGTGDNPVFDGMHEAGVLVAGATLAAADAVLRGTHQHAVNVAGGLHHAMRDRASGFCVYNDPALAIAHLLREGVGRVAYVDVDVHHGDGVEAAFRDDPRVLTVSVHESGRYLFPGTGFPHETGRGDAAGTAVNVALPPGTGDDGWLRAFDAVVPPLLRAFAPDVLVTQHGADTHASDPLAHLELSVDGQRAAAERLHGLAHELTAGRWVATGGGGYALVEVVPRSWTHLLATAAGGPVDPFSPLPSRWRDLAARRRPQAGEPPRLMTDGRPPEPRPWEGGVGDPDDPVDRAVAATREHVFALHGLDPHAAGG